MLPRIANTRTPAVKQVHVLTMQVIKASLKRVCFEFVFVCVDVFRVCMFKKGKDKNILVKTSEILHCGCKNNDLRFDSQILTYINCKRKG